MAIVVPVVFSDCVNEKMGVALKFANLAEDVTDSVAEITECGDTVNFPKYDRVADIKEITKGTAVTPKEVSMTENKATIKQTGGAIRVYDRDEVQIKGRTMDNMAAQLADGMAKDLDDALSAVALAKATKKSPQANATSVTADEIWTALDLFGDDRDTDRFKGIAINSRLLSSLMKMDEFTSTEKTYQADGNGIIKNGLVGFWAGIPCYLTNNGTFDSSANETITYIVQKGALGYVNQKDVTVEIEREAKLFANDIVTNRLYAVNVLDSDGIVILRKTVA